MDDTILGSGYNESGLDAGIHNMWARITKSSDITVNLKYRTNIFIYRV
jgi:hypothetical protein